MLVSRKEVEVDLKKHIPVLAECIVSACNDFFIESKIPRPIKARTQANLIYDYTEAHVRDKFENFSDVTFLLKDGLFMVVINEKYVVRFKKFDQDKMPRNIPTKQTKDYMSQELDLPNMPEQVNLILGYELNKMQTQLQEITITCPNGRKNAWWFNIDERGNTTAEIIELPISPDAFEDDNYVPMRARDNEKKIMREGNE